MSGDAKELATTLLQLTQDEAVQAMRVDRLRMQHEAARHAFFEAKETHYEIKSKREEVMKSLGLGPGGDPAAAQRVLSEVLNVMGEGACNFL